MCRAGEIPDVRRLGEFSPIWTERVDQRQVLNAHRGYCKQRLRCPARQHLDLSHEEPRAERSLNDKIRACVQQSHVGAFRHIIDDGDQRNIGLLLSGGARAPGGLSLDGNHDDVDRLRW